MHSEFKIFGIVENETSSYGNTLKKIKIELPFKNG